jgi:hypothetical protein
LTPHGIASHEVWPIDETHQGRPRTACTTQPHSRSLCQTAERRVWGLQFAALCAIGIACRRHRTSPKDWHCPQRRRFITIDARRHGFDRRILLTYVIYTASSSVTGTATVLESGANLQPPVNQRVREFWSVWNGHRVEKWHFGTAPRVSVSNQRVGRRLNGTSRNRRKRFSVLQIWRRARENAGHSRARRFVSTGG